MQALLCALALNLHHGELRCLAYTSQLLGVITARSEVGLWIEPCVHASKVLSCVEAAAQLTIGLRCAVLRRVLAARDRDAVQPLYWGVTADERFMVILPSAA